MFKYKSFLLVVLTISCKPQNEVEKQNSCLISKIFDIQTNKLTNDFKYDSQNRLIEYTSFNNNCSFIYNLDYSIPNQIKVSYKGDCLKEIAAFYPGTIFLDKEGNASKIITNEKNSNISLKYENGKLKSHTYIVAPNSSINAIYTHIFEYLGNNISKVKLSYEDKVSTLKYEYIPYETKKFDDKPNYYPKEFKYLVMYSLSNIRGGSLDAFNENICLDQTVYPSQFGIPNRSVTFYEYNAQGYPLKSGSSFFSNGVLQFGDSKTFRHRYEFECE
jgi:hypothetical protein